MLNNDDFLVRRKKTKSKSLQSNFFKLDIEEMVDYYCTEAPQIIEQEGFTKALQLFHEAAERVPAYKNFLNKSGIDHKKIKTLADFKQVPIIDKKNYLRAYPLKDLLWDGEFKDLYILSSSSGSTGEPFLWPRGEEQELEGGLTFELIFKKIFKVDKYSTLYIDIFSMGTWIAGPFVLACAEYLSKKGYPLLTVTPGIDKEITFSLFKNLASQFDQIVLSGYPPFIKDIIDVGENYGVNWKKYRIRFLFAAEGFSEKWRDYLHDKVGASDDLVTSINLYGSADAAILAHETPLTTTIRRLISNDHKKVEKLFGDNRLPTLGQYDPRLKFFEEVDRSVVFSSLSGVPLIRYSIGDTGGVFSFNEMERSLLDLGYPILSEIKRDFSWKLPFVYVFGRTDLTISFYGLLIYPEHVKYGIERSGLDDFISGKFVMSTESFDNQDSYWKVRIELSKDVRSSTDLQEKLQKAIVKGLRKVNSEFKRLNEALNGRAIPEVELIENGDIEFFKPGAKQRWIKKDK
jgi:phenylacetate-CoA ligase